MRHGLVAQTMALHLGPDLGFWGYSVVFRPGVRVKLCDAKHKALWERGYEPPPDDGMEAILTSIIYYYHI